MTRSRTTDRRPARRWPAVALLLLAAWSAAEPAVARERWGWFGIRIRELTETEMEEIATKLDLREGYGVLVVEILKGGPAETSSLRTGDLIVAIDGRPVVETRALQRIVGGARAGQTLRVTVLRERRRQELAIQAGEMPLEMVAERVAAEFGFLVRGTNADEPPARALARSPVVSVVAERSPAARGGLLVNDRVLAVNGTAVSSLDAFQREVQVLTLREPMRLRVDRNGDAVDLVLPAPAKGGEP